MILFPAIDLKDGACVRLVRGEMESATVFNEDPAAQARAFEAAGFEWLHVVDLDGAFAGRPVNRDAVRAVAGATGLKVQLGGGIRDRETVEAWLEAGVRRVILGTAAVRDPEFARDACARFPGRIVIGIDGRGGRVAVEGWAETSEIEVHALARAFEDAGAAAIVYTDIDRDGALGGLNVEATVALARRIETPVIASGGVSGPADLEAIAAHAAAGIEGVIAGRALYDGRLDAVAALALMKAA